MIKTKQEIVRDLVRSERELWLELLRYKYNRMQADCDYEEDDIYYNALHEQWNVIYDLVVKVLDDDYDLYPEDELSMEAMFYCRRILDMKKKVNY